MADADGHGLSSALVSTNLAVGHAASNNSPSVCSAKGSDVQENEGKAAPLLLLSGKAASRASAKPYGCLDGLAELLAGAQQLHTDSPRLLAAATGAVVSFCKVQHGLKLYRTDHVNCVFVPCLQQSEPSLHEGLRPFCMLLFR